MSRKKLIEDLVAQLSKLPHRNDTELDALKRKSEMIIRNLFGDTSKYLTDLKRIRFHPAVYPTSEERRDSAWRSGTGELNNLLQTAVEELSIFGENENPFIPSSKKKTTPTGIKAVKIFVVHGRDDVAKVKVARFLEKLDVKPIILHEQPNNGRTVIEKFEGEASDVNFAVVLLTGDDRGMIDNGEEELQPRARQNVIFELGYFIGVLGRSKVVALCEKGVEIPSDYAGILYIDLDDRGRWELELAKEIKNSGIEIDMNKAIS